MVWSSPAHGNVFLGRDPPDMCGVQNLAGSRYRPNSRGVSISPASRIGCGVGHGLESEKSAPINGRRKILWFSSRQVK
jgi:hypothetical protein